LSDASLKIVGADVVEFTPIYDNAAETTGIAVGQIIYEILHWMVSYYKTTTLLASGGTTLTSTYFSSYRFMFLSRDQKLNIKLTFLA